MENTGIKVKTTDAVEGECGESHMKVEEYRQTFVDKTELQIEKGRRTKEADFGGLTGSGVNPAWTETISEVGWLPSDPRIIPVPPISKSQCASESEQMALESRTLFQEEKRSKLSYDVNTPPNTIVDDQLVADGNGGVITLSEDKCEDKCLPVLDVMCPVTELTVDLSCQQEYEERTYCLSESSDAQPAKEDSAVTVLPPLCRAGLSLEDMESQADFPNTTKLKVKTTNAVEGECGESHMEVEEYRQIFVNKSELQIEEGRRTKEADVGDLTASGVTPAWTEAISEVGGLPSDPRIIPVPSISKSQCASESEQMALESRTQFQEEKRSKLSYNVNTPPNTIADDQLVADGNRGVITLSEDKCGNKCLPVLDVMCPVTELSVDLSYQQGSGERTYCLSRSSDTQPAKEESTIAVSHPLTRTSPSLEGMESEADHPNTTKLNVKTVNSVAVACGEAHMEVEEYRQRLENETELQMEEGSRTKEADFGGLTVSGVTPAWTETISEVGGLPCNSRIIPVPSITDSQECFSESEQIALQSKTPFQEEKGSNVCNDMHTPPNTIVDDQLVADGNGVAITLNENQCLHLLDVMCPVTELTVDLSYQQGAGDRTYCPSGGSDAQPAKEESTVTVSPPLCWAGLSLEDIENQADLPNTTKLKVKTTDGVEVECGEVHMEVEEYRQRLGNKTGLQMEEGSRTNKADLGGVTASDVTSVRTKTISEVRGLPSDPMIIPVPSIANSQECGPKSDQTAVEIRTPFKEEKGMKLYNDMHTPKTIVDNQVVAEGDGVAMTLREDQCLPVLGVMCPVTELTVDLSCQQGTGERTYCPSGGSDAQPAKEESTVAVSPSSCRTGLPLEDMENQADLPNTTKLKVMPTNGVVGECGETHVEFEYRQRLENETGLHVKEGSRTKEADFGGLMTSDVTSAQKETISVDGGLPSDPMIIPVISISYSQECASESERIALVSRTVSPPLCRTGISLEDMESEDDLSCTTDTLQPSLEETFSAHTKGKDTADEQTQDKAEKSEASRQTKIDVSAHMHTSMGLVDAEKKHDALPPVNFLTSELKCLESEVQSLSQCKLDEGLRNCHTFAPIIPKRKHPKTDKCPPTAMTEQLSLEPEIKRRQKKGRRNNAMPAETVSFPQEWDAGPSYNEQNNPYSLSRGYKAAEPRLIGTFNQSKKKRNTLKMNREIGDKSVDMDSMEATNNPEECETALDSNVPQSQPSKKCQEPTKGISSPLKMEVSGERHHAVDSINVTPEEKPGQPENSLKSVVDGRTVSVLPDCNTFGKQNAEVSCQALTDSVFLETTIPCAVKPVGNVSESTVKHAVKVPGVEDEKQRIDSHPDSSNSAESFEVVNNYTEISSKVQRKNKKKRKAVRRKRALTKLEVGMGEVSIIRVGDKEEIHGQCKNETEIAQDKVEDAKDKSPACFRENKNIFSPESSTSYHKSQIHKTKKGTNAKPLTLFPPETHLGRYSSTCNDISVDPPHAPEKTLYHSPTVLTVYNEVEDGSSIKQKSCRKRGAQKNKGKSQAVVKNLGSQGTSIIIHEEERGANGDGTAVASNASTSNDSVFRNIKKCGHPRKKMITEETNDTQNNLQTFSKFISSSSEQHSQSVSQMVLMQPSEVKNESGGTFQTPATKKNVKKPKKQKLISRVSSIELVESKADMKIPDPTSDFLTPKADGSEIVDTFTQVDKEAQGNAKKEIKAQKEELEAIKSVKEEHRGTEERHKGLKISRSVGKLKKKPGRPYKKKTLTKMVKQLKFAEGQRSDEGGASALTEMRNDLLPQDIILHVPKGYKVKDINKKVNQALSSPVTSDSNFRRYSRACKLTMVQKTEEFIAHDYNRLPLLADSVDPLHVQNGGISSSPAGSSAPETSNEIDALRCIDQKPKKQRRPPKNQKDTQAINSINAGQQPLLIAHEGGANAKSAIPNDLESIKQRKRYPRKIAPKEITCITKNVQTSKNVCGNLEQQQSHKVSQQVSSSGIKMDLEGPSVLSVNKKLKKPKKQKRISADDPKELIKSTENKTDMKILDTTNSLVISQQAECKMMNTLRRINKSKRNHKKIKGVKEKIMEPTSVLGEYIKAEDIVGPETQRTPINSKRKISRQCKNEIDALRCIDQKPKKQRRPPKNQKDTQAINIINAGQKPLLIAHEGGAKAKSAIPNNLASIKQRKRYPRKKASKEITYITKNVKTSENVCGNPEQQQGHTVSQQVSSSGIKMDLEGPSVFSVNKKLKKLKKQIRISAVDPKGLIESTENKTDMKILDTTNSIVISQQAECKMMNTLRRINKSKHNHKKIKGVKEKIIEPTSVLGEYIKAEDIIGPETQRTPINSKRKISRQCKKKTQKRKMAKDFAIEQRSNCMDVSAENELEERFPLDISSQQVKKRKIKKESKKVISGSFTPLTHLRRYSQTCNITSTDKMEHHCAQNPDMLATSGSRSQLIFPMEEMSPSPARSVASNKAHKSEGHKPLRQGMAPKKERKPPKRKDKGQGDQEQILSVNEREDGATSVSEITGTAELMPNSLITHNPPKYADPLKKVLKEETVVIQENMQKGTVSGNLFEQQIFNVPVQTLEPPPEMKNDSSGSFETSSLSIKKKIMKRRIKKSKCNTCPEVMSDNTEHSADISQGVANDILSPQLPGCETFGTVSWVVKGAQSKKNKRKAVKEEIVNVKPTLEESRKAVDVLSIRQTGGAVAKRKRKLGRPYKKKTLMKMAKQLVFIEEQRLNGTETAALNQIENHGGPQEISSHQAQSCKQIKTSTKVKQTSPPTPVAHLRRYSRACKVTTDYTVDKIKDRLEYNLNLSSSAYLCDSLPSFPGMDIKQEIIGSVETDKTSETVVKFASANTAPSELQSLSQEHSNIKTLESVLKPLEDTKIHENTTAFSTLLSLDTGMTPYQEIVELNTTDLDAKKPQKNIGSKKKGRKRRRTCWNYRKKAKRLLRTTRGTSLGISQEDGRLEPPLEVKIPAEHIYNSDTKLLVLGQGIHVEYLSSDGSGAQLHEVNSEKAERKISVGEDPLANSENDFPCVSENLKVTTILKCKSQESKDLEVGKGGDIAHVYSLNAKVLPNSCSSVGYPKTFDEFLPLKSEKEIGEETTAVLSRVEPAVLSREQQNTTEDHVKKGKLVNIKPIEGQEADLQPSSCPLSHTQVTFKKSTCRKWSVIKEPRVLRDRNRGRIKQEAHGANLMPVNMSLSNCIVPHTALECKIQGAGKLGIEVISTESESSAWRNAPEEDLTTKNESSTSVLNHFSMEDSQVFAEMEEQSVLSKAVEIGKSGIEMKDQTLSEACSSQSLLSKSVLSQDILMPQQSGSDTFSTGTQVCKGAQSNMKKSNAVKGDIMKVKPTPGEPSKADDVLSILETGVAVTKVKRKRGRPYKKKALMRMAKPVTFMEEPRLNDTETAALHQLENHSGSQEISSHQAQACKQMKTRKKVKLTSPPTPISHLSRYSQTSTTDYSFNKMKDNPKCNQNLSSTYLIDAYSSFPEIDVKQNILGSLETENTSETVFQFASANTAPSEVQSLSQEHSYTKTLELSSVMNSPEDIKVHEDTTTFNKMVSLDAGMTPFQQFVELNTTNLVTKKSRITIGSKKKGKKRRKTWWDDRGKAKPLLTNTLGTALETSRDEGRVQPSLDEKMSEEQMYSDTKSLILGQIIHEEYSNSDTRGEQLYDFHLEKTDREVSVGEGPLANGKNDGQQAYEVLEATTKMNCTSQESKCLEVGKEQDIAHVYTGTIDEFLPQMPEKETEEITTFSLVQPADLSKEQQNTTDHQVENRKGVNINPIKGLETDLQPTAGPLDHTQGRIKRSKRQKLSAIKKPRVLRDKSRGKIKLGTHGANLTAAGMSQSNCGFTNTTLESKMEGAGKMEIQVISTESESSALWKTPEEVLMTKNEPSTSLLNHSGMEDLQVFAEMEEQSVLRKDVQIGKLAFEMKDPPWSEACSSQSPLSKSVVPQDILLSQQSGSDTFGTVTQVCLGTQNNMKKRKAVKEEIVNVKPTQAEPRKADDVLAILQTGEAVTKVKRKRGRPCKKKTLMKMPKQVSFMEEQGLSGMERSAIHQLGNHSLPLEVSSHQAQACKPRKASKNVKQESTPTPIAHLRRYSRACKVITNHTFNKTKDHLKYNQNLSSSTCLSDIVLSFPEMDVKQEMIGPVETVNLSETIVQFSSANTAPSEVQNLSQENAYIKTLESSTVLKSQEDTKVHKNTTALKTMVSLDAGMIPSSQEFVEINTTDLVTKKPRNSIGSKKKGKKRRKTWWDDRGKAKSLLTTTPGLAQETSRDEGRLQPALEEKVSDEQMYSDTKSLLLEQRIHGKYSDSDTRGEQLYDFHLENAAGEVYVGEGPLSNGENDSQWASEVLVATTKMNGTNQELKGLEVGKEQDIPHVYNQHAMVLPNSCSSAEDTGEIDAFLPQMPEKETEETTALFSLVQPAVLSKEQQNTTDHQVENRKVVNIKPIEGMEADLEPTAGPFDHTQVRFKRSKCQKLSAIKKTRVLRDRNRGKIKLGIHGAKLTPVEMSQSNCGFTNTTLESKMEGAGKMEIQVISTESESSAWSKAPEVVLTTKNESSTSLLNHSGMEDSQVFAEMEEQSVLSKDVQIGKLAFEMKDPPWSEACSSQSSLSKSVVSQDILTPQQSGSDTFGTVTQVCKGAEHNMKKRKAVKEEIVNVKPTQAEPRKTDDVLAILQTGEAVTKVKIKRGRPYKKKTLMKMAKQMSFMEEPRLSGIETAAINQLGNRSLPPEVSSHQAQACKLRKASKNVKLESTPTPIAHLRRYSRACKVITDYTFDKTKDHLKYNQNLSSSTCLSDIILSSPEMDFKQEMIGPVETVNLSETIVQFSSANTAPSEVQTLSQDDAYIKTLESSTVLNSQENTKVQENTTTFKTMVSLDDGMTPSFQEFVEMNTSDLVTKKPRNSIGSKKRGKKRRKTWWDDRGKAKPLLTTTPGPAQETSRDEGRLQPALEEKVPDEQMYSDTKSLIIEQRIHGKYSDSDTRGEQSYDFSLENADREVFVGEGPLANGENDGQLVSEVLLATTKMNGTNQESKGLEVGKELDIAHVYNQNAMVLPNSCSSADDTGTVDEFLAQMPEEETKKTTTLFSMVQPAVPSRDQHSTTDGQVENGKVVNIKQFASANTAPSEVQNLSQDDAYIKTLESSTVLNSQEDTKVHENNTTLKTMVSLDAGMTPSFQEFVELNTTDLVTKKPWKSIGSKKKGKKRRKTWWDYRGKAKPLLTTTPGPALETSRDEGRLQPALEEKISDEQMYSDTKSLLGQRIHGKYSDSDTIGEQSDDFNLENADGEVSVGEGPLANSENDDQGASEVLEATTKMNCTSQESKGLDVGKEQYIAHVYNQNANVLQNSCSSAEDTGTIDEFLPQMSEKETKETTTLFYLVQPAVLSRGQQNTTDDQVENGKGVNIKLIDGMETDLQPTAGPLHHTKGRFKRNKCQKWSVIKKPRVLRDRNRGKIKLGTHGANLTPVEMSQSNCGFIYTTLESKMEGTDKMEIEIISTESESSTWRKEVLTTKNESSTSLLNHSGMEDSQVFAEMEEQSVLSKDILIGKLDIEMKDPPWSEACSSQSSLSKSVVSQDILMPQQNGSDTFGTVTQVCKGAEHNMKKRKAVKEDIVNVKPTPGEPRKADDVLAILQTGEAVTKVKRKRGRPCKKKTLMKMPKQVSFMEEQGLSGMETAAFNQLENPILPLDIYSHQAQACKPRKTSKNVILESTPTPTPIAHLRRYSRACKVTTHYTFGNTKGHLKYNQNLYSTCLSDTIPSFPEMDVKPDILGPVETVNVSETIVLSASANNAPSEVQNVSQDDAYIKTLESSTVLNSQEDTKVHENITTLKTMVSLDAGMTPLFQEVVELNTTDLVTKKPRKSIGSKKKGKKRRKTWWDDRGKAKPLLTTTPGPAQETSRDEGRLQPALEEKMPDGEQSCDFHLSVGEGSLANGENNVQQASETLEFTTKINCKSQESKDLQVGKGHDIAHVYSRNAKVLPNSCSSVEYIGTLDELLPQMPEKETTPLLLQVESAALPREQQNTTEYQVEDGKQVKVKRIEDLIADTQPTIDPLEQMQGTHKKSMQKKWSDVTEPRALRNRNQRRIKQDAHRANLAPVEISQTICGVPHETLESTSKGDGKLEMEIISTKSESSAQRKAPNEVLSTNNDSSKSLLNNSGMEDLQVFAEVEEQSVLIKDGQSGKSAIQMKDPPLSKACSSQSSLAKLVVPEVQQMEDEEKRVDGKGEQLENADKGDGNNNEGGNVGNMTDVLNLTANSSELQVSACPTKKSTFSAKCHFCGRTFLHITAYIIHRRIHTGEKPYRCQECGKTFAQLSHLNAHRKIHKLPEHLQCPLCASRFSLRDKLLSHFLTHTNYLNQNNLIGESVNKSAGIKAKIITHFSQSAFSMQDVKPFKCLNCGKQFRYNVTLKKHTCIQRENMPFSCKVCDKVFKKASKLIDHEKKHWPIKPFACSVCGKGFSQLGALKTHSRTHTGEKPFSCARCGDSFLQLSFLRAHQASKCCLSKGTGEDGNNDCMEDFVERQSLEAQENPTVPFKCQVCSNNCDSQSEYNFHLLTHTDVQTYLCDACGQQFTSSDHNAHLQICCRLNDKESQDASPSTVYDASHLQHNQPVLSPDHLKRLHLNSQQSKCSDPSVNSEQGSVTHPQNSCKSAELLEIGQSSSTDSGLVSNPTSRSIGTYCKLFKTPKTIKACMPTSTPRYSYTCGRCGKALGNWNKYWLHQRVHSQKPGGFCCSQCSKHFHFHGLYKEHMLEHAKRNPYACPICPIAFADKESLKDHQGEEHRACKTHNCHTCGKRFINLGNLKRHSHLHRCAHPRRRRLGLRSGVLPRQLTTDSHCLPLPNMPAEAISVHRCRECSANFTTLDLLAIHQLCHSIGDQNPQEDGEIVAGSLAPEHQHQPRSTPSHTPLLSSSPVVTLVQHESLYAYPHPDNLYVYPTPSTSFPPPVLPSVTNVLGYRKSSQMNTSNPELPAVFNTSDSSRAAVCKKQVHSDHPYAAHPQASPAQSSSHSTSVSLSAPQLVKHSPLPHMSNPIQLSQNNSWAQASPSAQIDWLQFRCNGNSSADFSRVPLSYVKLKNKEEMQESLECAECGTEFGAVSELYEHYIQHARGEV